MVTVNKTTTQENPANVPLSGAELVRIVQSGANAKATVSDIAAVGVVSTVPVIINTDVTFYDSGIYRLSSGQLTSGFYVYGVNCNIACEYVPADFPNNVMISWNFPPQSNQFDFGVRTYPHLAVNIPSPFPAISAFSTIEITFDYTVNGVTTNDVLIDMFLNNVPVYGTAEIEFFARQPESLQLRNSGAPYITVTTAEPDAGIYDIYEIIPSIPIFQVFPVFFNAITGFSQGTNPTLAGSVAGTPGTDPTNCNFMSNPVAGITKTIIGSGTAVAADGQTVNYVDVQYSGTPGSSTNIDLLFETSGLTAPTFGQWLVAWYVALIGGSLVNTTISVDLNGYSGSLSSQTETYGTAAGGINASLTSALQKFCVQARLSDLSSNLIAPHIIIAVTSGNPVNFTLRIASPNFLPGAPVTTGALFGEPVYSRSITSGRIDILALLQAMITAGFITGSETFTTVQIGPEIVSGQGSMYFSKFSAIVN